MVPVTKTLFKNVWAGNVKYSPRGCTYNIISSPRRSKFSFWNFEIWRSQKITEEINQLNPFQFAGGAKTEVK